MKYLQTKATQDDIRLGLANGDVSNGHSLVYSQEDLGVIFNPMMLELDELSVTVTSPAADNENCPINHIRDFIVFPFIYKSQNATTWKYVNKTSSDGTGRIYYKYNDTVMFTIRYYEEGYNDRVSMTSTGPLIFKNVEFNFPKIETSLPC